MQRGLALVTAALVLGTAGLAGAASRPSCGTHRQDGWVSLTQPTALSSVSTVAPSPTTARRLLATDSAAVVASTNGGCSWTTVFQVGNRTSINAGQGSSGGGVEQILVEGEAGDETVWLGEVPVVSPVVTAARLQVGPFEGPFTQATGLPPVGALRFALNPDARHGYALGTGATGEQTVYATSDGGKTWTARASAAIGTVIDVEADPVAASRVYLLGTAGLFRSEDAGATVQRVELPKTPSAITTGGAGLVAFADGKALTSRDGGRTFRAQSAPAGVVHADSRGPLVVAATRFGDFARQPDGSFFAFTPERALALQPRLAFGVDDAAVVGHTSTGVFVYPVSGGSFRRTPPTRPVAVPHITTPDVSLKSPVLTPPAISVSLGPGGSTTVPYSFRTPPHPGPLDVYFLVDTTASMDSALNGLRRSIQDIIDSLAATGLDVQFGVGDFRDVDQLVSNPVDGYVYRRDQPIAPPGAGLARALAGLETSNGTDTPEAQTIALQQAATGVGMPGVVPPGQDAGFRPGSTRVIVLVTDSPFHQTPPYPSMAETISALTSVQARVLGIAVATDLASSDPRPDERTVAIGTGTLAPPEGIDCDGDGARDVAPNAPAVCEAQDGDGGLTNVGDPIVSLLRSVQVPGQIAVTVAGHAVRATAGALVRDVDLSKPSTLPFAVTYGCGKADVGKSFPTTITGRIGSADVVAARATVQCLAVPPKPGPNLAPAAQLAPLAPAIVTALPPPPPPPPAQPPNAPPNVNPNVQPNINPAAAAERQHQLQLALAQQEAEQLDTQEETELAMSARPRRDEERAVGALAGMLALSSLTAVAVVRRTRPQLAR